MESFSTCLTCLLVYVFFVALCLLFICLFWSVVTKFTWNTIVSWARSSTIETHITSLRTSKTSCQAVLWIRKTVSSLRRNILMHRYIVCSRSWKLILSSFASSKNSSKISNTAVFIASMEVLSIFTESKSGWILSRSRNTHLLLVWMIYLGW